MVMKPNPADEHDELQMICLKTQISLVRNVTRYPFPTQNTRKNAVPVESWLKQLAKVHPYEDLTRDEAMFPIAAIRYGLAPTEDRHEAYHLLRFTPTFNGEAVSVWCELMAGNHFTFSMTGIALDLVERVTFLEAFVDQFASVLDFAYDEQFGYLTSLPTLTGTGLRIRSWVHLPGLTAMNYLPQLVRAAEVKGVLTEYMPDEEPPPGDLFILYNRFSLNLPVSAIVRDYKTFLKRVAHQELRARMRMAYDRVANLYDELNRTLLLCQHANIIPEREALNLLSSYWLGCSCGALTPIKGAEYAFSNCFDLVRDDLCPQSLLTSDQPYDLTKLPSIFRNEYLLNYDILRALWLRKIAESTFTKAFLNRVNHL
jgi:protein arginine kinase